MTLLRALALTACAWAVSALATAELVAALGRGAIR